jgi:catalase-peroxidase
VAVKKKYGNKLSWADLILARGQHGLRIHGPEDLRLLLRARGHLASRKDTYWGAEKEWLAPSENRYEDLDNPSTLENPLAAVQMGLIYVNPGGRERTARPDEDRRAGARDLRPHGHGRRGNRGADLRRAHRRQGHGNGDAARSARAGSGAAIEDQGFGWMNPNMGGKATNAVTSASKARGRPTRPSGTWAISTCCSATSGN